MDLWPASQDLERGGDETIGGVKRDFTTAGPDGSPNMQPC